MKKSQTHKELGRSTTYYHIKRWTARRKNNDDDSESNTFRHTIDFFPYWVYIFAEMAFLLTKVLSIVRPSVRPYGIHVTYESGFSLQYSSIPFWV